MPTTYEPIATTTLGSAQASIEFTSITGTYTDLVLVGFLRATTTTFNNMNFCNLSFNGDESGTNYSATTLFSRNTGSGYTANSTRGSNEARFNLGGIAANNFGSNIFSAYTVNIMNYANTTTNKTVLGRISTGGDLTNMDPVWSSVGLWRNTAAITSVKLSAITSGNFASGSSVTLYGIKAA